MVCASRTSSLFSMSAELGSEKNLSWFSVLTHFTKEEVVAIGN